MNDKKKKKLAIFSFVGKNNIA